MLRRISAKDRTLLAVYEHAVDTGRVGPAANTVLFSHATGFHGHIFDTTIRALRDTRCLSMDHRGHGRSAWAPHHPSHLDFDWRTFGDDVGTVLGSVNGVNGGSVLGVGHSFGATALIMAALRSPHLFRGLVLYEPVMLPPLARAVVSFLIHMGLDSPLAARTRKRRTHFPSRQAALDNFSSKQPMKLFHPDVVRDYVRYGLSSVEEEGAGEGEEGVVGGTEGMEGGEGKEGKVVAVGAVGAEGAEGGDGEGAFTAQSFTHQEVQLRCLPHTEAIIYNSLQSHNSWARLGELAMPVWVVRGKREKYEISHYTQQIQQRIPGSHFVEWPNSGHFGPFQDPERFAELIRQALESTSGATDTGASS